MPWIRVSWPRRQAAVCLLLALGLGGGGEGFGPGLARTGENVRRVRGSAVGVGPRNCLWPRWRPGYSSDLQSVGSTGKRQVPGLRPQLRLRGRAGPAPPPEAPPLPPRPLPFGNVRAAAEGRRTESGGKAHREPREAQDARTGRCGATRLPPGQQVQGPRARPGVGRCLDGVTRRAHARVHGSRTVHFVACK